MKSMKQFSISTDALQIVNAREEESKYSGLCAKHNLCPFCASDLILTDPNKLTYATCSNSSCNTAYCFNTSTWVTLEEMK